MDAFERIEFLFYIAEHTEHAMPITGIVFFIFYLLSFYLKLLSYFLLLSYKNLLRFYKEIAKLLLFHHIA